MKNLFDYATKELCQDAFLRWLFESHEDTEIGDIANSLLGKFCDFQYGEKVKSLETVPQWNKIDISVWMETSLGRKIALFIEDKTFSNEHSQLMSYDEHIDEIFDHEIKKLFFKTEILDDDERNRIDEANAKNKYRWQIFDINDIWSFFKEYEETKNLILLQYINHVKEIHRATINTKKPKTSKGNIDFLNWKYYFRNVVIPALNKNSPEYWCGTWKAGQYPYVVLFIKKLGFGECNIPYLEIRSRDCCNNNFKALILCYGISDTDLERNQLTLIENIKLLPDFECKRLVGSHHGKKIYPKQVGQSRDNEQAETNEQFISLVEKYTAMYLQVMKDWK